MVLGPEQEALVGRVFGAYVAEHYGGDLLQLSADRTEDLHQAVVVNAMTLFEASMEVGDYFNACPADVLAVFDQVLNRTAKEQGVRRTLHARITGLPVCPELTRDTIPRSRDVGHFLSVTGTVIRTSVAKVLEYERDYMCAKCRHVFAAQADFDQFYTFVPPVTCPNPDGCNSYKFSCLSGGSEPAACKDYQEIKVQEQVQRLSVGCIPRSMVVALEDDLVDSCKSGDDVTVYGVMCQRWKPFYDGARCEVELVLRANNIEVNNQQAATALLTKDAQKEFEDFWNGYKHDPIAGRNQILLSLCPQVFGMYVIKLAVAMVLAGGVQRIDSSGTKIRGECHMLLVGDPGTGKSQFLKYAAKIMPRSVLTAGIGSTSAGLTVAAVKDGGDWHLEAGALVLSDGGLCCIDEFNSIKEHDRISIHEAMEQQSISVAKAGMVCKLNTRTTILAATNPKGQYDPNEPLSVNVALASPLLSRFDLVLVLLDTRNPEWDRIISSFILEDRGLPADSGPPNLWSMEKMKAYFTVIKRLQPQVSEEANAILTRYYQVQRQSDGRNAARTTIRMLESLSRLAEAHARLMHRETVTIEDAVMAVSVMECSMQGGALLGNVNALLTSFPADPTGQYRTQCQILLEGLSLPLLLQKELARLARQNVTSETSQSASAADATQHQVKDTAALHRGIATDHDGDVPVEGGLAWFHAITSSVSSDEMTSPIITSTQHNHNGQQKSHWPDTSTVDERPSCRTETNVSKRSLTSEADVSDPCGSSDASQKDKRETGENGKEKTPVTQKEPTNEFVFQKVSKSLRGRRLELKKQQREKGGDRGQSGESPTNALDATSSTLSSVKTGPSDSLVQGHLCSSNPSRPESGQTKNISSLLKERMAADADGDLHAKLSGFVFKPRKMKPPTADINAPSRVSGEFHIGGEQGGRARHSSPESRTRKPEPDICVETASLVTNAERPQGKTLSNGGPKERASTDDAAQQGRVVTCQSLPAVPASNSTSNIRDPAPSKSAVASSALAKLSRFAFSCTTEPTAAAQSHVEESSTAVERGPLTAYGAECLKVKRTLMDNVKGVRPPPEPELTLGQEGDQEAQPGNRVRVMNEGSTVRKRKCFELGPPPGAGLALFDSVDLSSDVFDTDWDREVSKKAKV